MVDPCPHVDQPRVRTRELAIVAERCGRDPGVPCGAAVGVVGVGPFYRARAAGDESCAAGLVVVQICDGAGGVVDLLDLESTWPVDVAGVLAARSIL